MTVTIAGVARRARMVRCRLCGAVFAVPAFDRCPLCGESNYRFLEEDTTHGTIASR